MSASPPRVLQVVLRLDPGGTERLVIEIATRLHPTIPMRVCCLDEEGAWAGELRAAGIEVVALGRTPGFHPSLGLHIAALAREHRATALHCHHYSSFVYGRLAALRQPGLGVVFTEHGRLSDTAPSLKRRLATGLFAAGVSHLYAVSHDLRRHLLDEGFPARMGVVWNGIAAGPVPSAADRVAGRARLGVAPTELVVGTVARLDPVKDLGTLIDATARLRRDAGVGTLVIVGDGTERAALEARASAAGIAAHTRFLGRRDDARALVPGFDVFANSSVIEGVSLTLLEAMAAGVPVVATAVGGTPEVVLDGVTGTLVPVRDAAALGAALASLASAPDRRAAFGAAGRQRLLDHFTVERMVAAYAAAYRGEPAAPGGRA